MSNNDLYCSKCKSNHHPVDCPKEDNSDWLVEHLEKLFSRGYYHGVSGGMSGDGEFHAVSDTKQAIRKQIEERLPEERGLNDCKNRYKLTDRVSGYIFGFNECLKQVKEKLL